MKMHSIYRFLTSSVVVFLVPLVSLATEGVLENPLPSFASVDGLLGAIVNMVQIIAVPFIVFFIIYSGFLFVTARGNEETLNRAKKALIYAIIGGVVIAGAIAIGTIVENTADQF